MVDKISCQAQIPQTREFPETNSQGKEEHDHFKVCGETKYLSRPEKKNTWTFTTLIRAMRFPHAARRSEAGGIRSNSSSA